MKIDDLTLLNEYAATANSVVEAIRQCDCLLSALDKFKPLLAIKFLGVVSAVDEQGVGRSTDFIHGLHGGQPGATAFDQDDLDKLRAFLEGRKARLVKSLTDLKVRL